MALALIAAASASAQSDTLRLADLYAAAAELDARQESLALQERATALSLANLRATWYPSVTASAKATYQSETASLSDGLFAGLPVDIAPPEVPRDQYEAAVEAEQLIYDGGRTHQARQVARARLEERRAEVRASVYPLRQQVDHAFFGALASQEQRAQLQTIIDDLQVRQQMVAARVREGAAIGADRAMLEAEIIRRQQDLASVEGERLGALRVLGDLVGRRMEAGDLLVAPEVGPQADAVAAQLLNAIEAPLVQRPELDQLESTSNRLRAEARTAARSSRPRLAAFGRAAYGRPGFDFFDETMRPYAIVGVRASWPLLDWGAAGRRAEVLELQARSVEAEAEALRQHFRREVASVLYDIRRLEAALASDEQLVALYEEAERAARRQLEGGALLAADYVDRRSDVFEARLRQRLHRVELTAARVRLLTSLGIDVSPSPDEVGLEAPVAPAAELFERER